MFREIRREIATQGLKLSCPDTQSCVCPLISVRPIDTCIRSMAVAVGATSYYLDHFAASRIVRYTYGTLRSVEYDPSDPEHRKRSHKKYLGMTGEFQLDIFSPIVIKVIVFTFFSHPRN